MQATVGSRSAGRSCLPGFAAVAQLDSRTSVVSVTGEIDLATVPSLEQELLAVAEDRTGEVIVDLTGCTFLDARALGVLARTRTRLAHLNRTFALVLSNPNILQVLRITGFDEQFAIYPSLTVAVAADGGG